MLQRKGPFIISCLVFGGTEVDQLSPIGYTRWNSDAGAMEIYTGNEWVEVITDYFPSGSVVFD